MLQKTEMSQASTNAQQKTTSFFTTINRQMFHQLKKNESPPKNNPLRQISKNLLPNDLLILNPQMVSSLAWPQIFTFENDLTAKVKGNYYQIQGLRNNNKFIPRRSQPDAELVFFFAQKPTRKINLITIERFLKYEKQQERLWLHLNLSKYQAETNNTEWCDFYLECQKITQKNHQIWDFCSFQTIQNCRKGVFIFRVHNYPVSNQISYKMILVNLQQNLSKNNPLLQNSFHILNFIDLECEAVFQRQAEDFIKTIKSQFGDVILMITNRQIYQIQIEQIGDSYQMNLKLYKVSKIISNARNNYLKSQNQMVMESQSCGINNKQQKIIDAQFVSNGLKIMILTNYQQFIVIEAHNFLFGQSVIDVFGDSQIKQKYDLNSFIFTKLYPIKGSIALQFNSKNDANILKTSLINTTENTEQFLTKGILLLKIQNNSLYFMKLINLQLQHKDIQHLCIREEGESDQILLQYIQKKNPCLLNIVKCKTLMNELNSMTKIDQLQYSYCKIINARIDSHLILLNHRYLMQQQKKHLQGQMPESSRVIYMMQEKQLTCYKLFSEVDIQVTNKPINKLFSHTFFERPLKLAVSPLTLHFAIIFKQFVKFFYFNFENIKNYFTLKMKNINDVCYVGRGQKILISSSEGIIYLLDSYSFREQKILQIYGQPIEAKLVDQKHLLVRSSKNILSCYERGFDESQSRSQFKKVYEVKLEDNDQYCASLQNLMVFRNKCHTLQVYSHHPQPIQSNLAQTDKQCLQKLRNVHPHMVNRKKQQTFKADQLVTKISLLQQLGFLLISTNKGNIKQIIWPLQHPTNPNPVDVLTQQVSSCKIISFFMDARYSYLYSISQNGCIQQLQICQYIMGERMPIVYLLNNKTKGLQQQKRQFTDRNYLIDEWSPTEVPLTQAKQETIDELNFFIDKKRDDIDEMTKALQFKIRQQEQQLKKTYRQNQKQFKNNFDVQQNKQKEEQRKLQQLIDANDKQFESKKNEEVEKYQKKLLELYRESDRLKQILRVQDSNLTAQKKQFVRQFQIALRQLNEQKTAQLVKLQNDYRQIQERRLLSEKQNRIESEEEEKEMDLYKMKLHQNEQQQFNRADEIKETYLGQNTKRQKQISNLKKRAIYFQNLILQTKVQITELLKDKQQYQIKKQYLRDQLRDKEEIIEKIERELVHYLKNTEDMKTIKNNHEFQLSEYEQQLNPIEDNFKRIETNVKQMNVQIMKQYNLKVEKSELIKEQLQLVNILKQKKRQLTIKKLEERGRFTRVAEKITELANHPFDCDVKNELKGLLSKNMKSQQIFQIEQTKQRQLKEAERLMRYKNMIRKQIEQEQKREEHIIKNQHQYYHYHQQNTTLVREFNELKKTQKYLSNQKIRLEEKINLLRASRIHTPLRRVPSINLQKIVQKKMTPYQQYEEEQQIINSRKKGDTSETRLSRNAQSVSFLKGLMKEINQTDSKNDKVELMRERVRTFVNPELKIKQNEDIKKILFGRSRMTSQMLKLK